MDVVSNWPAPSTPTPVHATLTIPGSKSQTNRVLVLAALAVSAMFAVLMVGYILFQTSQIVNGGETNYIMATVGLYLSIYNLFLSLLQLLGAFSGDD